MFRKKNKEQATPKGVVGTNIEDIRLTKKSEKKSKKQNAPASKNRWQSKKGATKSSRAHSE